MNTNRQMDSLIINNYLLLDSINSWLKKENQTQESYEEWCKTKNLCVTIISEIKVSPYKFNKDGKFLINIFLDIHTNSIKYLSKNKKTIQKNIKENHLNWGEN